MAELERSMPRARRMAPEFIITHVEREVIAKDVFVLANVGLDLCSAAAKSLHELEVSDLQAAGQRMIDTRSDHDAPNLTFIII